jgi:DNA repair exonuclease SbcCD ATPase subunit
VSIREAIQATIRPNELKAARAVLHYAFAKFPVLDGWDEEHHCAQVIADHTRHEGKTAQQWADECRSYQRNLADAQADIAGEVAHSQELATRITELEALASRLKEQRDTPPTKPCWWLCLNPYPEGGKPTVYHPTLADAKAEAERLASKTGEKIHVLRIVGTACPPKAARWEER